MATNPAIERSKLFGLLKAENPASLPVRVETAGEIQIVVVGPGAGDRVVVQLKPKRTYDLLGFAPITWWKLKASSTELLRALDKGWLSIPTQADQLPTPALASPQEEEQHTLLLWNRSQEPQVAPANKARLHFDGSKLKISENGGEYTDVVTDSVIGRRVVWRDEFMVTDETVTIYCDPVDGDDDTATGELSAPFKTIQASVNSIPYGFLAGVIIQLLPGTIEEDLIDFSHLRHGAIPYPKLIVRGAVDIVHTFVMGGGGTSPVVSAGGVTKFAQHVATTGTTWATPIVSGDHFFRVFVPPGPGGDRYYAAPCLGQHSDHTTGALGYCGVADFLLNGDTIDIYTCENTFSQNVVRIEGHAQRYVTFEFIDISEPDFMFSEEVQFVGCKMSSTGAKGNGINTLEGCYFVASNSYVRINDGDQVQMLYCYFDVGVFLVNGNILNIAYCVFTHNQWKLVLGADYVGSNKIAIVGNLSMRMLNNCDFEGPGVGIDANHCTPRLTGNLSFEGGSSPLRLRHGSVFLRDAGLLTGKGTGAVLVESGSQMSGAGVAHTYTNTSTAGDQIKVGVNAAITFASVGTGKNDFAAGDTSQGCRVS